MRMREWNGRCQRCYKPSTSHIMSMFSEALICPDCKEKETKRDDYKEAEARDLTEYAGRLSSQGLHHQAQSVREQADRLRGK